MQTIKYAIEKTDGTVVGFSEKEEFTMAVSEMIEKQEHRAAFTIDVLLKEIHARDEQIDLIYSELRQSPKFVAKLRKNGAYADGTPRLVILIPRELAKKGWWLNPNSEHGIIITSPWAIAEIGDEPGDEGPLETGE